MNGWPSRLCALVLSCVHLCACAHTQSCVIYLTSFPSEDTLALYLCLFSYQDHSGICTGDFSFFSHFPLYSLVWNSRHKLTEPCSPLPFQPILLPEFRWKRTTFLFFHSGFLLSNCQFTEHRMFSIIRNYQTSTLPLAHRTSNEGIVLYQPSKCGYWAPEMDQGDWGMEF